MSIQDTTVLQGPTVAARAVTPNDNANLPNGTCRGLYVGTTGNLVVVFANDTSSVTLNAVPVGFYPFAVLQVKATSTTASNIVALY